MAAFETEAIFPYRRACEDGIHAGLTFVHHEDETVTVYRTTDPTTYFTSPALNLWRTDAQDVKMTPKKLAELNAIPALEDRLAAGGTIRTVIDR